MDQQQRKQSIVQQRIQQFDKTKTQEDNHQSQDFSNFKSMKKDSIRTVPTKDSKEIDSIKAVPSKEIDIMKSVKEEENKSEGKGEERRDNTSKLRESFLRKRQSIELLLAQRLVNKHIHDKQRTAKDEIEQKRISEEISRLTFSSDEECEELIMQNEDVFNEYKEEEMLRKSMKQQNCKIEQCSSGRQSQFIGKQGIEPIADINKFIHKLAALQCYIEKDEQSLGGQLYPRFNLFTENGSRYVMSGRKKVLSNGSHYIFSTDTEFKNIVGEFVSNFFCTEYVISDNENDLALVKYTTHLFPRPLSMKVSFDKKPKGTLKKQKQKSLQRIYNTKEPIYNEEKKIYYLDFQDRAKKSSSKNFQLVDGEMILLQLGKVDACKFNLDFEMTPFMAFAIGLTAFDYKIASD